MSIESDKQPDVGSAARFHTTHWSIVLAARGGKSAQARDALETLFRTYWFPLYAWARRQGYQPADAEDLTQGFMKHLLEHETFQRAKEAKGRLRTFLLAAFRNYLTDVSRSASTLKRGGAATVLSLDEPEVEERYIREQVDKNSPDMVYDRRWAVAVIEAVLKRLEQEARELGNSTLFRHTKGCLAGGDGIPNYPETARSLGMSEGALRVAVHRLRQRYRELLLDEIAQTVSTPEEVEEEVSYLLKVAGG